LIGGQISTMFVPLGTALSLAPAGKVRVIGTSGRERSKLAPDMLSLHEQGLPNFHFPAWFSAWGPAKMSQELVTRYNTALRDILAEPDVVQTLAKSGVSTRFSSPQELDKLNREDYEMLAKLIKDANIKGD
jgi:tripartite-type tricarboxylate transporter receptor subunit TctC